LSERVDGRALRAKKLRDARRNEILKTARKLFATVGYQAVSIDDIIEAADIARGTFYLHFETKQELFGEMLDALVAELRTVLVRVDVNSTVPPFEQLVANVERAIGVLSDNADMARLVLRKDAGGDTKLEKKLEEFHEHALSMIRDSIAAGRRMGLVRKDLSLPLAAVCALGSIKEAMERLLLDETLSKRSRNTFAREILDLNFHGLLADRIK
jgi:AcrR family transcriptional regulator